jgi:hypothetical protein
MNNILNFICGMVNPGVSFDWTAFWTFILAIATFLLCYIGWSQLAGIKKVSQADFLKRFSSDFFNTLNRNFILLCDWDCIELREKGIKHNIESKVWPFPYFEANQGIIKQLPIDKEISKQDSIRQTYTCYEIDDFLGYFEDIGKFEKQGFIDIHDVYDSFDWYIQTAHENKAIKEYLMTQSANGSDFYENFKYIFKKCQSFGESKKKDGGFRLWKFRWRISNFILKR